MYILTRYMVTYSAVIVVIPVQSTYTEYMYYTNRPNCPGNGWHEREREHCTWILVCLTKPQALGPLLKCKRKWQTVNPVTDDRKVSAHPILRHQNHITKHTQDAKKVKTTKLHPKNHGAWQHEGSEATSPELYPHQPSPKNHVHTVSSQRVWKPYLHSARIVFLLGPQGFIWSVS